MALVFIQNALQVNFDSVLNLHNRGILKVFKALESSGLEGFLGCSATVYDEDLQDFFANANMERETGQHSQAYEDGPHCQIGSFDVVTQELLDIMVAIMGGVKINWSKILVEILKAMVDPSTKQASGFAVQISLLLEGDRTELVELVAPDCYSAGRGVDAAGGAPEVPPQQQVAQQSEHQRFTLVVVSSKKKSGSSSSRSGSSSSSGSKVEFCGQCGGNHPTAQCVGVQGSCNVCGQYGNFARVCPLAGSQHTAAPP
ncbi:hypothetical protein F511_10703 [Dorcoceras hygrometricum]|uniref:CCHC-type domain-containing protein n=1 Tax=Dorcoceras hygrometricum TaxID=472368 RepID=A0A2Z7CU80_9LAMI|nr:hypothetical protein F511_10703 [Dorcoceras hygrometricum]